MSDDKKMFTGDGMRPIVILPPDTMDDKDIAALRDNGLCVVVAKDPARVKFLDPIPVAAGRTKIETAAIMLSRKLLNKGFWNNDSTRDCVARTYVDILMKGTALDPNVQEEEDYFNRVKVREIERLAIEEAREERAAKKAAKKAASQ